MEQVDYARVVDLDIGASKSDICAIRVVTVSERAGRTRACNRGSVSKQLLRTLSGPVVRQLIEEQHRGREFAAVTNYVTARFGIKASTITAKDVAGVQKQTSE